MALQQLSSFPAPPHILSSPEWVGNLVFCSAQRRDGPAEEPPEAPCSQPSVLRQEKKEQPFPGLWLCWTDVLAQQVTWVGTHQALPKPFSLKAGQTTGTRSSPKAQDQQPRTFPLKGQAVLSLPSASME